MKLWIQACKSDSLSPRLTGFRFILLSKLSSKSKRTLNTLATELQNSRIQACMEIYITLAVGWEPSNLDRCMTGIWTFQQTLVMACKGKKMALGRLGACTQIPRNWMSHAMLEIMQTISGNWRTELWTKLHDFKALLTNTYHAMQQ